MNNDVSEWESANMRRIVFPSILTLLLLAGPAAASELALFGSYWQPSEFDDTVGGGLLFGFGSGVVQFELRGTYYPDITEDLNDLLDSDDDFLDNFELKAIPAEAGILFNFAPGSNVSPYLGGGATYYILDSNIGEVDDEVGFYVKGGLRVGGAGGGSVGFLAEALYRNVEGSVKFDPQDLGDIDDVDFEDDFDLDLSGFAANVGIVFRF
jgi:hypothetical protein